ncbi:aminopeptidase N [Chelativorans sp. ZYF759]|uniref:aminopeptidase N n=1 Tax=Chelativorans sp. ZYF759 TaxID=2692213 RepID=UPI00145FC74B|nr:aminopeptidase N [Chelativorans sp. ZYF759]NMG38999.1 aminopeptidase N [Chelativorans sp. ZYF759]
MAADTASVYRIEDYRPSDYLIPRTHLTFSLAPDATRVVAELEVERREGAPLDAPLVLDGDGLQMLRFEVNGKAPPASRLSANGDRLVLTQAPPSRRFRVTIETVVAPASNTTLMGLYRSGGVYCTQCEAEGFRRITYYLDRPDVLSVYTVRIEAGLAEAPVLLSNGNPVEQGALDEGRHFAVWHDPHPKPAYLFALVAGDLGRLDDSFVTASGRKVDLAVFVEHGKEARATYAMDALKRSMRWDEDVFGLEYDLDVFNIVAVPDFNMGAMENKGLNIFNDKYILADEDTATDADYANIEAIVAHEYFHNWTGNRITCRDWFQLCLKEGLTVYRDHEFSADQRSRAVERIGDVRTLRALQFPEDQGPLAHPVRPRRYREINNFYTATVYEKGAEVVRMIATVLGEDDFRAGMKLYFERHDGQAVTIEDFLKAFEDASGRDLAQFALWYHQAGTPNLTISDSHDAEAGEYLLDIEQAVPPTPSESRKRLMHIPLAFGLVGEDGVPLSFEAVEGALVQDGVIHLRKRRHTVRFSGLKKRPVASVNRGFSAPVTVAFQRSRADRLLLARSDEDAFARWEAINGLMLDESILASRMVRGGKRPEFDDAVIALHGEIAGDASLEPAFRALALASPGETDIAREIGDNIDPDAILAARLALTEVIGSRHASVFEAVRGALRPHGPFRPDAEGAGRRALGNTLMEYLSVASGDPALAARQFAQADNMTDRHAALVVLVHRFPGSAAAAEALADFERRHGGDLLVMDKWFHVQATIPGPEALDRVRALTRHPAFSMSNPNRVRALIGAFANANQTGFHRPDGAAYGFFVETILALDRKNPQVSARMATALRSWRSLEPTRQAAARAALLTLSEPADLSTDLRDIVERTLA